MRLTTIAALVLVLAACARPPAWHDNPPPDGDRWFAVGTDLPGNREGAVASGRHLIALRLGQAPAPKPAFSEERLIRLAAGTPAPAEVPAPPLVQVEDAYDGDRSTRALVSFDRSAWLRQLDEHLARVDAELTRTDGLLPANGSALEAVRLLRAVAPLWPEREALIAARRQVEAPDVPARVDRAAQVARIRAALSRIPVVLDGDQAVAATLPAIRAELFRAGWLAGDTGLIALKTNLVVTSRFLDGTQRLDGILTGSIGGEPLRLVARGDGTDEALARDRLAVNLGAALAVELDRRLVQLAERP